MTSFNPLWLSDFIDISPELPRGTALHVPDIDSNWREDAKRLGVSTILTSISNLTREVGEELHDRGYRVGASLLVGPGDVRQLLELDVDASSSNMPEYGRALLEASEEFTARFPTFTQRQAALDPIST